MIMQRRQISSSSTFPIMGAKFPLVFCKDDCVNCFKKSALFWEIFGKKNPFGKTKSLRVYLGIS